MISDTTDQCKINSKMYIHEKPCAVNCILASMNFALSVQSTNEFKPLPNNTDALVHKGGRKKRPVHLQACRIAFWPVRILH